MNGIVFDIKEFSLHDGPGARTTVFLKGCPLRCKWCHNPEGQGCAPQLMVTESRCMHCGRCYLGCSHPDCQPFGRCLHICPDRLIRVAGYTVSDEALAGTLRKHAAFWQSCEGGVTLSGGEPLMQPDFAIALLKRLPDVHKAIQTSGHAPADVFQAVARQVDYVMLDIKLADAKAHLRHTGCDNAMILANMRWLKKSAIKFLIRTPLIPGITDTAENLHEIASLIGDAPWQKLRYNEMAGAKYPSLGMAYPLDEKRG